VPSSSSWSRPLGVSAVTETEEVVARRRRRRTALGLTILAEIQQDEQQPATIHDGEPSVRCSTRTLVERVFGASLRLALAFTLSHSLVHGGTGGGTGRGTGRGTDTGARARAVVKLEALARPATPGAPRARELLSGLARARARQDLPRLARDARSLRSAGR
jgi:hypothetical protein